MLLEARDIAVSYGGVRALSGVTVAVPEAGIVTVLGANGAGKTSLLRALLGLVPCGGAISFDGRPVQSWPASRRVAAGMALVPEGRQILLSLTVEENLLMGANQRTGDDVQADLARMYDLFPNLARRRLAPGSVLSGGEQQMLAIGRALMARPRLLMMDEPSLGLSPLFVRQVFDLIRRLNAEGLSILLVEQNTRLALRTAHYGYVLRLGHPVADGPTDVLLASDGVRDAYFGAAARDPSSAISHHGVLP